ncbi:MAG: hypothetical protein ACTHNW_21240 [Mucilaginibacter sp.]
MKENDKALKGLNFHDTVLFLLKYMVHDREKMPDHVDLFKGRLDPAQFATASKALEKALVSPQSPFYILLTY